MKLQVVFLGGQYQTSYIKYLNIIYIILPSAFKPIKTLDFFQTFNTKWYSLYIKRGKLLPIWSELEYLKHMKWITRLSKDGATADAIIHNGIFLAYSENMILTHDLNA